MKGRLIVSLAIALVLVAVLALPAMAVEQGKTATVTVSEYIGFTITDPGAAGLNWGTMNPGQMDGEDAQTAGAGAVTLNVSAETNVDCTIQVKGSGDFSDGSGHSFALSYAEWDDDNDVAGATDMTTSYATIGTSTAGAAYSQHIWHWLGIPNGQYAATYNTTFYYQATKS